MRCKVNCAEYKELLVAYIEGLLSESDASNLREHLKNCPSCQKEQKQIAELHNRLVKNGKTLSQSNLEAKVMNQILRDQKSRLRASSEVKKPYNIWRLIMKSKITKLAIAAAIIIAVLIGLHSIGNPFGATVTFAKVVEPILKARTIICDMIIGNDENNPSMHEIIVGSRIRRTMSNMPGMTHIIDLENSQMLVLIDEDNTASYVNIEGDLGDRTQSYVNFLRNIIMKLKNNPNIEKLGEQIIDGHKAVGFTGRGPNEEVTIWADAKTALPIRIYLRVGQMGAILKNFELDSPVDDSLLSMDVPAGYTLKETQFDLGNATEQDFVESLRIWAKVLGDGTFPDAIGTESAMKEMPMLGQKLGKLNLSEEQATQMGMAFGKGMLFHQMIDTRGDDWRYVGAGVKLGDASKAVFWYQPKGSETYRVIYGDLSVKNVAPEDLPK
jgi:outer membrane lipoprotein-sorting protein